MHGRSEFLMESWLSRIMHCILEVVNLFVLAVFGAVITSQLTTASILAVPPTVNDLRGLRIGIQTNLLQPILQSVQVAAIPVIYNTLEDAVKLIYTTNPDNLDGYMTTTEIVQYFNQKYGNGQFVQTATFLSSDNTPDQKAFAISKALPRATESLFNQALESHRTNGDVAALYNKYIAPTQIQSSDDALPLDSVTRIGVSSAAALASILLLVLLVVVHFWSRRRRGPLGARQHFRRQSAGGTAEYRNASFRASVRNVDGCHAAASGGGGNGCASDSDEVVFRGRSYRLSPADAAACQDFLSQCAERARLEIGPGSFSATAGWSYKEAPPPPQQPTLAPVAVFSTSPMEPPLRDRP